MSEDERQPAPPVEGCPEHAASASPDCAACLAMYGLTLDTPGRVALMTPRAIHGRWKPGQSGNPRGPLPGERSMEQVAKKLLAEMLPSDDPSRPAQERMEILTRVLLNQAIRPDPRHWAVKLLVERLWPKRVGIDLLASASINVTFDDQDRELFDAIESGRGLDIGLDDETGEGDGDG